MMKNVTKLSQIAIILYSNIICMPQNKLEGIIGILYLTGSSGIDLAGASCAALIKCNCADDLD